MRPGRIPCCVPFCRRTCRCDGTFSEWICGNHWCSVSKRAKAFKRRAFVAHRAAVERYEAADERLRAGMLPGGLIPNHLVDAGREAVRVMWRARARASRAWERCKRQAIEAAGGIG